MALGWVAMSAEATNSGTRNDAGCKQEEIQGRQFNVKLLGKTMFQGPKAQASQPEKNLLTLRTEEAQDWTSACVGTMFGWMLRILLDETPAGVKVSKAFGCLAFKAEATDSGMRSEAECKIIKNLWMQNINVTALKI